MAGYVRQSSFVDGDTITAALFNDEYNQLVNAFHNSTGHAHDGTAASGPVIGLIGDAGETSPNNKVLIDTSNNYIEFYVEVSSNPVQQLYIADGAIIPVTDNDIDLGTSSLEFKDLYLDGTAHIDTLDVDANAGIIGNATVGGTLDVTGNTTLTANLTVNGNTTLGNAASDTVTITADVASNIIPSADSTHTLGDSSNYWSHGYIDAITTTGNVAVGGNLTVTGTTTFNGGTITMGDAATDNVVFGADVDSHIIPDDDDTYDLGSSSQEWRNLYIDGTANIDSLVADTADINGGTIDGSTIATSDITVGSGKTLDVSSGTFTLANDQISGDKVEGGTIAATTITTLTSTTGNITGVNATTVDTTNIELTNLKAKDGTSAGSIADSTGVVTLASSVLTTTDINGGTIDGATIGANSASTGAFTTLTTSGNATVGGNLTVTGTTTFNGGTITMGDAATDNVVFGADVDSHIIPDDDDTYDLGSASQQWRNLYIDGTAEIDTLAINGTAVTSTAAELNILDGVTSTAAELNILDGVTATTAELNIMDGVTATTAELNILDGVTASATDINLIDGITNGTVIASKAIITDSNKDITGGRNITISGQLAAATLDISGDVDIDGTLEADAITVNGTTLAETISDTVGAMVTSNTETGMTVSYDDSDNTLDFVIGTLNQDTTGNAATATALETARTIHGVSFDGTANIDLSEVIQDTVGAMVSSNTESGITVTYEDSDGTLDFSVGTLNQDTTGTAALATEVTVSANNSTDETVYLTFVDGATGSQGIETDTSLSYNPSTNTLAVANISVSGTQTIVDSVTMNANNAVIFEGATADAHETTLTTVDATADRTISLPNVSGTLPVLAAASTTQISSTPEELNLLDGATANTVVNSKAVIYGSSGELAGTLSTAAQPNITSLGTLTALTGGTGDFNWDSNTLVVDSSTNRVGILNASPDVSLDIGSATDAVHVPVGTTAQRPGSPAAGYFRYNTSLSQFEGYTDAWGAIGGGGTNTFTHDVFTGNGSTTAYALSQSTESEDNLIVFIDGVFQEQSAYSIATSSGTTTLTFSAAPANGRKIVVYTVAAGVSGSNLNIDTMTGDGSDTTLTLSIAPVNENNTQVFFDGVYQNKSTYSISGTTLTFSTAPPTGVAVEVMTFTQTDINVPVDNTITTAKLVDDAVTSAKLANNIDIAGTFDVTGAATFDSTATFADDIAINNGSPEMYFGTTGNHYNWRIAAQESVDAGFEVSVGSQDTNYADDTYSAVMVVKNTGKVGFGSSPTNHTDEIITITTPASGGGQGLAFKRLDSNSDQTVGTLRFSNNSTDDLAKIQTATDGANTSSRIKLQTNTGSGLTDTIVARSNGYVDFTGAADVRVTFGTTGTAGNNDSNWVRGENSDLAFNAASGDHKWEVGGTPVARLDADGLRFGSDTATANGLDDYEEGTWTPSLAGNNSNSGQSFATQDGTYTKIGRQVTCRFNLELSAEGTFGANYIKLTGFPFNIASTPHTVHMGNLYFVNMGTNYISVGLQGHEGVNQAYLWGKKAASDDREYVGVSELTDNTQLTGTFTYFV
jgi:hypothetical protein